ncbi:MULTISPECIES: hypothetical protein [unclassified Janthinobacterium]|uniref:hypothetical protein n=1 Tax=unclassified Janthinobacterium TaxID=2610881 RepID=UPI000881C3C5|nr:MULTISPECIES: hypothetical protein [unclassified Janthinobacterium]SDA63744.1 hypothetical protein SAMN03159349_02771 [Janthinobacterium sp. 551a]SFB17607.1 hypothetical protein SAMN03159300_102452 [Janthinobacterium sp. 344]
MSSGPTAKLIDELVLAVGGAAPDARSRHVLAQALHGLVRVARSEQLLDMQRDAARAVGAHGRRETRALLRRLGTQGARSSQGQLPLELLVSETDRA